MATLRDHLRAEPFALALSSGFFGFFAHAGFLTVLEDEGLLPTRLAGSSAGALVAGCWAAGLDAPAIAERFRTLRREEFWDPAPGLGLLRGRRFRGLLDETLPSASFESCRAPLAVSVYDLLARRTEVVDCGPLAPAIHASAAFPGMFQPVTVNARPCLDGGIADRPGTRGLPAGTHVLYHHLSSRSPWRRKGSPALAVPGREGQIAVVVDGLPRVSPFDLEAGPRAFEATRAATRRALDLVPHGDARDGLVVRLNAG
ncbi:MAG: patatin-like phospholipase family protein [Sandaracinus sp.]|nr:patatin-like phospholipase family protein [Sandaracinus sp.]